MTPTCFDKVTAELAKFRLLYPDLANSNEITTFKHGEYITVQTKDCLEEGITKQIDKSYKLGGAMCLVYHFGVVDNHNGSHSPTIKTALFKFEDREPIIE